MSEKQKFHIGTGIPSILMIFVVLCLTTFGILSYSSAQADYNLTMKNVEHVQAYYAADAKAQQKLAEIDRILYQSMLTTEDDMVYKDTIMSLIAAEDSSIRITDTSRDEAGNHGICEVEFRIEVIENQTLSVALEVAPLAEGVRYQIKRYQLVKKDTWAENISPEQETLGGLWSGN